MIKKEKSAGYFVLTFVMLLWACSSTRPEVTPTSGAEQQEQTQRVLTQTVVPTMTLMPFGPPTQTTPLIPTLPPIPNSTPAQIGAYFDVPSDVLGSRYEIENAYYFDQLETGERYEFYAGAMTGTGGEETAQGVMVFRILRFSEDGSPAQVIATEEYPTPIQAGPLQMKVDFTGSILLYTPLHFEWTFFVRQRELVDLGNPPLARLESGDATQLAGRGSFCWSGGCLDGPGITTSAIPLVLRSPTTVHLHLPLAESPDSLSLYSMMISLPGSLNYDSLSELAASWSYEKPGRALVDQGSLALGQDQDIRLSLEPGYHVLVIFAAWRDYGDVKYGFLVEVQE